MTLYTKCIFAPAEPSDGTRISVMSRHTLNDGVTPDERITEASYKVWKKDLAPPDHLVGAYYKRGLPWKEFKRLYIKHIQQPDRIDLVRIIAETAMTEDITLLCSEETAEHCHRRLLAEECLNYQPGLKIEHK
jgi:uncharacterized protein YeaO (DUF488 family)